MNFSGGPNYSSGGRWAGGAGVVLDVLVQRRRDKQAAKRLLRKL
jgi:hypothetical protein